MNYHQSHQNVATAILLLVAMCLSAEAGAQVRGTGLSQWIDRASLPGPRQEVGVAIARGRVFVVGGITPGIIGVNTVEAYDPATNTWSRAADLPEPVHHAMAAAAEGRLFVLGGLQGFGFTPVSDVWEYDFAGDRWLPRALMPTPRGAGGVAVWDGKIYVAAGDGLAGSVTAFERYDPADDSWEVLPGMSFARNHNGAAAVHGHIIVAAGRNGAAFTPQTEIYEIATGKWSMGEPIPTPRAGVAVVEVLDRVVVLGGEGNPGRPDGLFEEVEFYNLSNNRWSTAIPMDKPRHGIGAVSGVNPVDHRGAILVPGGAELQGIGPVSDNDALIFSY